MQLPPNLKAFQKEAQKAKIKDIEFSGSTYQVLVEDPSTHEDYWVFLQIEGTDKIRDAFCSCEEGHSLGGCLHLAAAYLSLFQNFDQPLHQRFSRSLWNHLCRLFIDQIGDDAGSLIELQEGHYICQSRSEKVIFSVKAGTKKYRTQLEDILFKRPQETEETSLKFSNLPPEEILLWREGTPSPQLRYDLSYWCDLAKWLIKLQEIGNPYTISFKYSKRNIPNWIQINFAELEIGFYLSEANLPLIIPALNTVNSPLTILDSDSKGISKIVYDKKEGVLFIESEKDSNKGLQDKLPGQNAIQIDGWSFIPNVGFYADEPHDLLQTPRLELGALSEALTKHEHLISGFLSNAVIHHQSIPLTYQLFFDHKWNLHIKSYLFEPGDLTSGDSRIIEDWIYLDDDGFYPIEEKRFEEAEQVIPISQVSDFVTQNRGWLNTQEGFETHIKSLEYQIGYELSDQGRLTFNRILTHKEDERKLHDFGSWVYFEAHGFFLKSAGSFNFLFKSGFSLSREQIPLFIRMNRDELALIPNFYNSVCPVAKAGLKIELEEHSRIKITPEYELTDAFKGSKMLFFDDIVYVEGHGFYELPGQFRLPEKFRHQVELEGEELEPFLTYELNEIRPFITEIDPRLESPKECDLVVSFVEHATEIGRGWYRFKFFYQTEKGLISVLDLIKPLSGKKKPFYAFFDEGKLDLRDHRFDWLRSIGKDRVEKKEKTLLLSTLEFMRLNAFNPVQLLEAQSSPETKVVLNELIQLRTPDEPNIGGLTSHLRPYQDLGVRWLWFLYSQNLSGLLCDDMGLGKTHQAMALLASVMNYFHAFAEGHPCHFLVVCPTSVIYHWQDKLKQFFPGIRVCTFYGSKRSLENFQEDYDILLTSYGILRNERETLAKIEFEVAIYDEIQVAKNQFSLVYSALSKMKAKMKLGLTGTPIENHLRELKSLFDIVLPTYMPSETEYRNFFVKPIEKGQDKERKKLLHRLVNPFILRRKKEEVLTDLPEKIEEIAYCDLHSEQHRLYAELLEKRRHHLVEELRNEHEPIPYLHVFALLSSLKQICDHPAVYLKSPGDFESHSSGKWTLFVELLREARESRQKVVVFSQYLFMLDIIEQYLTNEKIGFASLRGATSNRPEQIEKFQKDENCEVFVGSLQAAGLGIDLTAGSVVIHYDRWWNAARENQATDRVYRIGQTRGVQVFKLVTKGTFEEKIDAMIKRKGQLMEDVIGVDDQNTLKKFTRDELISLLELTSSDEELPEVSDEE